MKRIAIIGVPGSGKSALAAAIGRKFKNRGVKIVDKYIQDINALDILADHTSGYVTNNLVMNKRVLDELKAASLLSESDGAMLVTVGSALDTLVYQALHVEDLYRHFNDDEFSRQEININQMGTLFFGYHVRDTYNYDLTILMPLPEMEDDLWRGHYHKTIKMALDKYRVPHIEVVGTNYTKGILAKIEEVVGEWSRQETGDAESPDEA